MPAATQTSRCTVSDSGPAPGVALLAHGQLEGRRSTKRNRRRPVQRRTSPGFLTLWRPPVGFPMTILRCDAGDEFRQLILPLNRAQNNTALSVQGQCHRIPLPKACLFGDRERNSHSQTVPPFRDRRLIRHVSTLSIHPIALATAPGMAFGGGSVAGGKTETATSWAVWYGKCGDSFCAVTRRRLGGCTGGRDREQRCWRNADCRPLRK